MTDADVTAVLDPIRLGPAQLKNRVFVAPHTTNFGVAGENLITDRHLAYHRARARGGAGLIITEGVRVHPTSLRRLGIHAFDERAMPGLTALADTVHAEGAALFAQILHTGRHSGDDHYGAWGAGATPWSTGATVPHVMNALDIDTVVAGFAAASERVVRAGFDGMEVHLGHGHLLQQFLSPITNQRTDGYGGSVDKRLRLAREVLIAVRETVGTRAAVGVRLSADEFLPGGLGVDDVVGIVAALLQDVALDFLHVSHSAYIGAASLSTQMADMAYPRAPFRHLPTRFKQEFPTIPVLAICRVDTLATGAEMIRGGEADLVGFARAHIAEPALTTKTLSLTATPRSCIACNQGCNANLEAVVPITCTVNPAVGREAEFDAAEAAAAVPQRVLVVGAGAAGIEAAVTAARRGHQVTVAESDTPGGALHDVAALDARRGFSILARELVADLEAADVTTRFGQTITAGDIVALDPDVVVLATGARTDASTRLALPTGPIVLDLPQVVHNPAIVGGSTIVFDELGSWEAAALAEQLGADGVDVTLVSPFPGYAPKVTVYSRLALGDRLAALGVHIVPMHRPASAEGTAVRLAHTVDGTGYDLPDIDSIVHVRPPAARDELLEELLSAGWQGEVHLVGDAFAPRTAQEAVYEGRAVGLAIGVEDANVHAGLSVRAAYRLRGTAA